MANGPQLHSEAPNPIFGSITFKPPGFRPGIRFWICVVDSGLCVHTDFLTPPDPPAHLGVVLFPTPGPGRLAAGKSGFLKSGTADPPQT